MPCLPLKKPGLCATWIALAVVVFAAGPILNSPVSAQTRKPDEPKLAAASDEGERAIVGFRTPEGIETSLFASEPMLANPVAIYVDHDGRVFVCETYRQQKGVEDNRFHNNWLDDDLAAQTVEDRVAYIKKFLGDEAATYTQHDDRIRLLIDTDEDGTADQATVFASGFNEIESGTGAGVLAYRGDVFYTCIPDLWRMRDSDGNGVSDERVSMSNGYGVRFAFRGHDMHGLIIGPDGRLYFSIGDRGYNVTTPSGKLKDPASGAVFRCELDGSNLEVVATGLRNPQELAFDQYGNLFTGDNNSDSGDQARFVYVVRGSDTGWRMYYQYLSDRGPFNREKIWHPYHDGQPAYIVPPIDNLADGPSGLTYYPGTGLGDEYANRFFLCDFRGQASNSGIRTFRTKAKGAFFEIADSEQTFWSMLVTDAAFGPDGSLYASDWVHGWEGLNKGRIYRFYPSDDQVRNAGLETAELLGGRLGTMDDQGLVAMLGHADQRVRLEAQFELVRREGTSELVEAAQSSDNQLARLHAIWGLGQLGRKGIDSDKTAEAIGGLINSPDAEVRAQALQVAGDIGMKESADLIVARLTDESLRVRYFAAQAVGQLSLASGLDGLLTLLHENANADPIVRHGGIMGLVGAASDAELVELREHHSKYVRLAAVVAMRKRGLASVAEYLADTDEAVVVEAARAIHDLPLANGYPALAAMIDGAITSDDLLRRVINANFRLGNRENLQALLRFCANQNRDESARLEALQLVATWDAPSNRDWVLGDWRPFTERDSKIVTDELKANIAGLLASGGEIGQQSAEIAARFGVTETIPFLRGVAADSNKTASDRANALLALNGLKAGDLEELVEVGIKSDAPEFRSAAREVLVRISPTAGMEALADAAKSGTQGERQRAVQLVSNQSGQDWLPLKRELVNRLLVGEIPSDTLLEVLELAEASDDARIKEGLAVFESRRDENDPLSMYQEALTGGNVDLGRSIFLDRRDLSCKRCHLVGDDGGNVGPELTHIAKDKEASYLLESIVTPNKAIAEGFETLLVVTIDGVVLSGIVKHQDDDEIRLMTPEGETITILMDDVEETQRGDSSMPNDLIEQISKRELRDLLAFLNSLK